MFTLIIGGSASGKSEYAERLVASLPGKRIYIATMEPWDDECRARIAKHRFARKDRGFDTVECYTDIASADIPRQANVLLECLSNLVANEMYSPSGAGADRVCSGVLGLAGDCSHLTVVTNEIFSGGTRYEGDTLHYMRELSRINCILAAKADNVIEIVCGIPNILKGSSVL